MSENKSFDELLLPVRNDIDRIDKELLKLFTERMQCAERVAEIKRKAGIPVLNAAREQVILDRVKKEAGEYGDSAVALYSAIMSISRARQHNMLKSGGVLRDLEQNSPKTLKADPRVICQGAAGAFSHSAALRLFPGQKPIFLPGFRDVFEAVHNGAGDYGVVPVENSDAGSVSEVYDLIMKHRMFIVGAADIPVRHCLCRAKGTGAVKKVLSKHEALVQCSAYLAAHDIETEAYSNTAAAAKFIAETRLEGVGAVCSAQAAEEYGLEVIAADIQNTDNNCTRFIVISREAVLPEDAEKISLCFSLPHTPGSLCHTLERFALLGTTCRHLRSSAPSPTRCPASRSSETTKKAELKMAVTFIKVTEEEQIEKIAEIAAPIWHETYDCINGVASTDYMIEKFQSVPAIHRQMESEGYVYYMMLDDGVPAGFIGLVPHKEGKMFYVSAAHRSRGLPRAAFDFIETLCQAEKLPAIYLTVNKKNFHAIEVYKYFGFHQTDAVVTDIGSGFVMNDYIMQKDL